MKQQRERQKLQQDQERALQEMRQSCQERSHMLETKLQHQKQEQQKQLCSLVNAHHEQLQKQRSEHEEQYLQQDRVGTPS